MRSNWNRATKACRMGTRLAVALVFIAGVAVSSKAEDRLSKGIGIVRACADDVWRLCSDRLPGGGRIQDCIQDKMGQLSKGCVDALVDAMADQSFTVCKNQPYVLCAAARCNVYDGVAYCQCEKKSGDSISLTFKMAEGEDVCSAMTAGAQNQYLKMSARSQLCPRQRTDAELDARLPVRASNRPLAMLAWMSASLES